MATLGFEPGSPGQGGQGEPRGGRGRGGLDVPVTSDPTSPFCHRAWYTGSLARPPSPGLSQPVDTGSRPPLPVLCNMRWPLGGMGRRLGGWVEGSLPAVTAPAPLGPRPFLLLLFPQSSGSLGKSLGTQEIGDALQPPSCPSRASPGGASSAYRGRPRRYYRMPGVCAAPARGRRLSPQVPSKLSLGPVCGAKSFLLCP